MSEVDQDFEANEELRKTKGEPGREVSDRDERQEEAVEGGRRD